MLVGGLIDGARGMMAGLLHVYIDEVASANPNLRKFFEYWGRLPVEKGIRIVYEVKKAKARFIEDEEVVKPIKFRVVKARPATIIPKALAVGFTALMFS
jgi:hypothetical protein